MDKSAVYLYGFSKGRGMPLTMKAVTYAYNLHGKQTREDGAEYYEHPITVARYLVNHGILDDATVACGLLHDVKENCGISLEEISREFGKDTAFLVDLISKRQDETLEEYYARASSDIRAVIVKAADRTHNIGNMVGVFDLSRLKKYVKETKEHVLPMMKNARRIYLEYSDALVAFRDHINDVIKAVEKVIELLEEKENLEAEIRKLREENSELLQSQ